MKIRALMVLLLPLAVAACENTLMFQERTKGGLEVSLNEDPVEPVELLAGWKRSIVALVPPKEHGTNGAQSNFRGEALSLFSNFEAGYRTTEGQQTYVRTAFASGTAATLLANGGKADIFLHQEKAALKLAPADAQDRMAKVGQCYQQRIKGDKEKKAAFAKLAGVPEDQLFQAIQAAATQEAAKRFDTAYATYCN